MALPKYGPGTRPGLAYMSQPNSLYINVLRDAHKVVLDDPGRLSRVGIRVQVPFILPNPRLSPHRPAAVKSAGLLTIHDFIMW